MPDALPTLPPTLRRAFLKNRFDFDCDCPRCTGRPCDADGQPETSISADAALEALAPFAPAGTAAQAQALHRPLVIGVSDERRQLIGLRLREHDSFADALAATEPFWQVAPQLAPTHWQRCAVRQLRCLCLLELSSKAVPAALLLAEQARLAAV